MKLEDSSEQPGKPGGNFFEEVTKLEYQSKI